MSLKVLVTGASGQLGWEVVGRAAGHDLVAQGLSHAELDISNKRAVDKAVDAARPHIIVNAASYTAVEKAESEKEQAFAANQKGARNLALACKRTDALLIHVSTDYVFNGRKTGPYVESDPVAPINVYGASKLAGEEAIREVGARHLILRTAWMFGVHGANFVKTMVRLGRERDVLRVVDDQHGCPTYAADLADAILILGRKLATEPQDDRRFGTFHCVNDGPTTWCGFARAIFYEASASLGKTPRVEAISSADFPTKVERPINSVLDCSKLRAVHGLALRPWPKALADMLAVGLEPSA